MKEASRLGTETRRLSYEYQTRTQRGRRHLEQAFETAILDPQIGWADMVRQAEMEATLVSLASRARLDPRLEEREAEALEATGALCGVLRTLVREEEAMGYRSGDIDARELEAGKDKPTGNTTPVRTVVTPARVRIYDDQSRREREYMLITVAGEKPKIPDRQIEALGCYDSQPGVSVDKATLAVTEDDRVVMLLEAPRNFFQRHWLPIAATGILSAIPIIMVTAFATLDYLLFDVKHDAGFIGTLAACALTSLTLIAISLKASTRHYSEEEIEDVAPSVVANLLGDAVATRMNFWRRKRAETERDMATPPAWKKALMAADHLEGAPGEQKGVAA